MQLRKECGTCAREYTPVHCRWLPILRLQNVDCPGRAAYSPIASSLDTFTSTILFSRCRVSQERSSGESGSRTILEPSSAHAASSSSCRAPCPTLVFSNDCCAAVPSVRRLVVFEHVGGIERSADVERARLPCRVRPQYQSGFFSPRYKARSESQILYENRARMAARWRNIRPRAQALPYISATDPPNSPLQARSERHSSGDG